MTRGRGYRVCPDCGLALDPGDICDCQKGEEYPATPYHPPKVDKHLEACRKAGHYIQPGYRLK